MNESTKEKMLKSASQQLNISANELKALLNKGDMSAIIAKMDSSDGQKLKDALADPKVMEMMRNTSKP